MKKSIYLILSLSLILISSACSGVKVLSSWKADNASTVKDKNFIVIARTANNQARIAFEDEIVKQLSKKGMRATASFTKFPKLNPNQKVNKEKTAEIVSTLKDEGFNAVVLTVVKEVENLTQTTKEGGYYAGSNYAGYYPVYYGGFYNYYHNPMSYSSTGNYVTASYTTATSHNYVLETLVYNLDETDDKKQLVAVVTSKLEEPVSSSQAASQYVKAIAKSFDEK